MATVFEIEEQDLRTLNAEVNNITQSAVANGCGFRVQRSKDGNADGIWHRATITIFDKVAAE